ncbi:MAG: class I SAM-dependent methyltransferase [Parachlamydiaceae bacterium]
MKLLATLLMFCLSWQGLFASWDEVGNRLIAHVIMSIDHANQGVSKLTTEVLEIDGMSSAKNRHLLNNLCSLQDTSYLEIGSWKGSTWVSALYQNEENLAEAVAVDNWIWAEHGGSEVEFIKNCERFLSNNSYQYYSSDAFKVRKDRLFRKPVNVYFYDGDHSALSQELALTYFDEILDDVFILVVDDWNWDQVRAGTFNAFSKLQYHVLFSIALPARYNGDLDNWWNGVFIAVIRKPHA